MELKATIEATTTRDLTPAEIERVKYGTELFSEAFARWANDYSLPVTIEATVDIS